MNRKEKEAVKAAFRVLEAINEWFAAGNTAPLHRSAQLMDDDAPISEYVAKVTKDLGSVRFNTLS